MKYHIFLRVLMSTLIALPAFAQQGNSSSTAQPAASEQAAPAPQSESTTTTKEPQRERGGDFWEGDEPGAARLILHPFASKGYVQRHVGAIQDQLDEISGVRASNVKATRDLDTTVRQRIQLASAKTDEGEQHASDASSKAQAAQQTLSGMDPRLSKAETVVGNLDQYKATTQAVIHFRSGQTVLSKDAKHALDEMATPLKDQRGYVIEVQGFSSGHGQAAIAASRKMADSVVRYLVLNHEIPAFRMYVLALGNAPAPVTAGAEGTAGKRTSGNRVEISVLKNDLQLASSTGAGAPPK